MSPPESQDHTTEHSARLAAAEDAIGHRFGDPRLLDRALTHPSYSDDPGGRSDYERLEFLGDAVLGFIVAEEIYARFPGLAEGTMTKLKAVAVSRPALVEAATRLGLEGFIVRGRAETHDAVRGLASALENAFEAIVAAIYLDAGIDAARRFVLDALGDLIATEAFDAVAIEHPKSRLQEIVQAHGTVPVYRTVTTEGPPHARRFTVEVLIENRVVGTGSGASKREAEMRAATQALEEYDARS